jgi:hypothetical protein
VRYYSPAALPEHNRHDKEPGRRTKPFFIWRNYRALQERRRTRPLPVRSRLLEVIAQTHAERSTANNDLSPARHPQHSP